MMNTGRILLAAILVCFLAPPAAVAQWRPQTTMKAAVQMQRSDGAFQVAGSKASTQPNYAMMVVGGVLGAGIGLIGGGVGGAYLDSRGPEWRGAVIGSMVGTALLTPLGVHMGNRDRGNYPLAALVALAVTTAIFPLAGNNKSEVIGLGVPLQLLTSIAIERGTSRASPAVRP